MHVWRYLRYVFYAVLLTVALAAPTVYAEAVESYAVQLDGDVFLIDRDGDELVSRGVYRNIYRLYDMNGDKVPFYTGMQDYSPTVFNDSNPLQGHALINIIGSPITAFDFSSIEYAGGDRFFVTRFEKMGVIDAKGHVIVPVEYANIILNGDGGFLAVRENTYTGNSQGLYYLDESGAESATGAKIASFSRPYGIDYAFIPATDHTDKWGYLDSLGHWTIDPQYNWCDAFYNGYAIAAVDSGVGIIDAQGNWVLTPKYNYISAGSNIAGAPYIAGSDGRIVRALSADDFSVIAEIKGDSWSSGYVISDGLLVMNSDRGADIYDFKGNLLFSFSAGECVSCWFSGGYILVYNEDSHVTLYDMEGTLVSGPYQNVSYIDGTDGLFIFTTYKERKIEFGQGENEYYYTAIPNTFRSGIMDYMGNEIVKPKYDRIYQLDNDRLMAETPEYLYLIDARGSVIKQYAAYSGLMD
jgi:hypothetical protein